MGKKEVYISFTNVKIVEKINIIIYKYSSNDEKYNFE